MQEQFDELQAAVARLRKELETARVERDELTVALESSERAKQALDKQNRKLAADLKEAQTTLAEEGTKARYASVRVRGANRLVGPAHVASAGTLGRGPRPVHQPVGR